MSLTQLRSRVLPLALPLALLLYLAALTSPALAHGSGSSHAGSGSATHGTRAPTTPA